MHESSNELSTSLLASTPAHPSRASGAVAGDRPCIHMRAAAKHAGFTHALRRQAAEHLVTCNQLVVDVQEGLCTAVMLADITKPVYCRPREGVCTCHDHALHGICCHLMAAAMLPGEQCMEMQLAVELAAPAAEQETQVRQGASRGE